MSEKFGVVRVESGGILRVESEHETYLRAANEAVRLKLMFPTRKFAVAKVELTTGDVEYRAKNAREKAERRD